MDRSALRNADDASRPVGFRPPDDLSVRVMSRVVYPLAVAADWLAYRLYGIASRLALREERRGSWSGR